MPRLPIAAAAVVTGLAIPAGIVAPWLTQASAAPAGRPNLVGQWSAVAPAPAPVGPVTVTFKLSRQNAGNVSGTMCEKPANAAKARCVSVNGTVTVKGVIRLNAPSEKERVASGNLLDATHVQVTMFSSAEWFAESYTTLVKQ